MRSATAFFRDEAGATAIEYAFVASLIAAVIVGAVTLLGTKVGLLYEAVANGL